jgi:selenocysteine lyase/cysteine desulfurase
MDPETLRAEMPALSSCCYLNTGASGPSPRRVVEAAADFERRHQYEAPCGDGMYRVAREELEAVRGTVAGFLGATPAEVALTRSTVEGINHVATGMDWSADDVVVRTDLEHPAGELPWALLRDRAGVTVRELSTDRGRLDLDAVKDAVAGARLVCLSSLSWNYGTHLPVSEVVDIAHDAGARVLVDAVQSPGQTPVDVDAWGADFVAGSGHKWLLGLWGAGFLYVAEDAIEALAPRRVGYFSVSDPADGPGFRADARRFELGTTSVAPYVGLAEAIGTIEAVGLGTIESRIDRLTRRLKEGLGDRLVSPPEASSGLVTFPADDPDALVDRLADGGIRIRSIPEPHACRASVHVFNTAADIDRLLEAL